MNAKKRLKEKIKNEKLDVSNYFDKPSKKGTPTKNSVVLTVVFQSIPDEPKQDQEFVEYKFGFSIKAEGDNYSQFFGTKNAYDRYKSGKYQFKFPVDSLRKLYTISMFVGSNFQNFDEFCKKNVKVYNEIRQIFEDSEQRSRANLNAIVYQNGDITITVSDLFYCFDGLSRDLPNYYYKLNIEYFILQSVLKVLETKDYTIFVKPSKRNKTYMRIRNIIAEKLSINDRVLSLINNINDKFTKIMKEFENGQEKQNN